jgi:hypothetical protein
VRRYIHIYILQVLSGEELTIAIQSVLKNYSADEDAEWLLNQIDQDHDGERQLYFSCRVWLDLWMLLLGRWCVVSVGSMVLSIRWIDGACYLI